MEVHLPSAVVLPVLLLPQPCFVQGLPSALKYSSCGLSMPDHVLKSEVTAITRASAKLCEPAVLPESMITVLLCKAVAVIAASPELLAAHVSDHRKGEETNHLPAVAAFRTQKFSCSLFLSAVTSAACYAG